MRKRAQILASLEKVFREAFERAEKAGDEDEMARLDLEYQRDQLSLEVLLDVRELLVPTEEEVDAVDRTTSLIDQAEKLRRIARLR